MSDNNSNNGNTKGAVSQYYDCVDQGMRDITQVLDNISQSLNKQLSTMIEQLTQAKHGIKQSIQSNSKLVKQAHITLCEQREAINHRVAEHMTNSIRKVKLNIGGTVFTTTELTLLSKTTKLKEDTTFFSGLLGSGNWQPDSDGEYFIDRSPVVFPHILDYLRTGTLILEDITPQSRRMLLNEIQFYSIPFTHVYKQQLSITKPSDLPEWLSIENDGTTLSKIKEGNSDTLYRVTFTPLHDVMYSNIISWRLTSSTKPLNQWYWGVCGVTYNFNERIEMHLPSFTLCDQGQERERFFSEKQTPIEQADFMYCRSDQTVTITIRGISVTRKLHPNVAVNPCFDLHVRQRATMGSVHVELT